jgi:hypothetical protein
MSLSNVPTIQLLKQVETLNQIKNSGLLGEQALTPFGRDWCNDELSAIEAELDTRKPDCDFTDLLDGFEPVCFVRLQEAQEKLLVADFEQMDLGV